MRKTAKYLYPLILLALFLPAGALCAEPTPTYSKSQSLAADFITPPDSARPWAYWFWINGNITKEGITADLEAMKRVGIGGVIWMEVSGPWWAPNGDVIPASPRWHEMFRWAISECQRLGIAFDCSIYFGYGCGGPHITPDRSMQKLYWNEKEVEGGKTLDIVLEKPAIEKKYKKCLRPGQELLPKVKEDIEKIDSYRDVAVLAFPLPEDKKARDFGIKYYGRKVGLYNMHLVPEKVELPPGAAIPRDKIIDLTGTMNKDGRLRWNAPPGHWLVIRIGHGSNFKMTGPTPQGAMGLECDRLSKEGIEHHFDSFFKNIIEDAGAATGRALAYGHIDSWEARGQNWTTTFPEEFHSRRGYDIRPWIPALTGRFVGNVDLTERFLWDFRKTVGEMIRDNYAARFRELLHAHGMKLSIEAYGLLCIDNLSYAGVADMPVSEFWANWKNRSERFAVLYKKNWYQSSKVMASAAHTYGRPVVGSEAFTTGRKWEDHPYTLKRLGDWAFCQGVNRMIYHLSAHQPYENMVPGLTHRRWGLHFHRHNTWFEYSRPWNEYVARCQQMLRQGRFVADYCRCVGDGAPINVKNLDIAMPGGYEYDMCSAEIVLRMNVRDGLIELPSGMNYRYLVLPDTDRMTPEMARKVRELVLGGAKVIASRRPVASPSLADYPQCDEEVGRIAAELWDTGRIIASKSPVDVFRADGLPLDFDGRGLKFIHRRAGETDIYLVASESEKSLDRDCTFRVSGKKPQLWNPETGEIRGLPEFTVSNGRTTVPLHFEPMQSWFVVFSDEELPVSGDKNFVAPEVLRKVNGGWKVRFDPKWGGPDELVAFDGALDWSKSDDQRVKYYSGTAVYRKTIELTENELPAPGERLWIDLGDVEVMARVKVNGTNCGTAWKKPYRVDISTAVREGKNELEIDAVNLWINRMIGDELLPEDVKWLDFETMAEWPDWFRSGKSRESGRYTFSSCKHYTKDAPLVPSGILGPVTLQKSR